MQKALRKTISIVLVITMLFSVNGLSASAKQSTWKRIGSAALGTLIYSLTYAINEFVPDADSFINKTDFENKDFYSGTGSMLSEPAKGAQWKLGYASASLVPADWQEHQYYLGGFISIENFFTNKVEDVIDDMKVRTIALDDGSGRGVSVFATIDSIGVTNSDIKAIRRQLVEKAGESFKFASINVSSTHCHSCIDTEGLWTNNMVKIVTNLFKALCGVKGLQTGTDPHYMEFFRDTVSTAMLNACKNMCGGYMTYSRKNIGEKYVVNKNRSSASALMTDLTVLTFYPGNKSLAPTKIVNFAAHPEVAGLPTSDGHGTGRQLSGEYIYYMGETLSKAGFNCMFFNGAIAGIYMSRDLTNDGQTLGHRVEQSERYGIELGKMVLAMNMTLDEIMRNPVLYNKEEIVEEMRIAKENGSEYTLWCDGWTPVKAVEVEPILNVALKEVYVPVSNPIIILAGKLNLANYDVIKTEHSTYEICTEIGYVEIGKQVKAVMMPGEICPDLVVGGTSLTAEESYSGKAFKYSPVSEMFGDKNIICFGLMNDEIGYVVPDNDYIMAGAFDHYQEIVSIGNRAASSIMESFDELSKEIK